MLSGASTAAPVPEYGYRIVKSYPHDPTAFTEGLFYHDGALYESTGQEGRSSIRRVNLITGKVLQAQTIPPQYFGEGIVAWKDRLFELTWRSEIGFIYDLKSLKPVGRFNYHGEGWALTHDGARLIMSDGTAFLRFLDPATLNEIGRVQVTDAGKPVPMLNELEFVHGEVYANVWQTTRIARINPTTGKVVGWIDLAGLAPKELDPQDPDAVLNGIAYDPKGERLFVTGKLWPRLFEIKLLKKGEEKTAARPHG